MFFISVLAGRKRCLSLDTHQTKELSVNLGEQGGSSGNSKESTTNLHEQGLHRKVSLDKEAATHRWSLLLSMSKIIYLVD